MKNWKDYPIKKITLEDKDYPAILAEINNCPKQLYYRGNWDKRLFDKTLAVVGSRRMSLYGAKVIDSFVPYLVNENITIISGFMYGIDTAAHRKTIEYGGRTIAVFGCGLNLVYPEENDKLYSQILDNFGLVLSEYEPEFKPQTWTFPQRNRIVSGLSNMGVLIVEAGEKSGSLITAHKAMKQKRKVFAVPGLITSPTSFGTNELIKNNLAQTVTTPEDILGKRIFNKNKTAPISLEPIEKKIYQALEQDDLSADELSLMIKENILEIGRNLSIMSLKGIVKEVSGRYCLV